MQGRGLSPTKGRTDREITEKAKILVGRIEGEQRMPMTLDAVRPEIRHGLTKENI